METKARETVEEKGRRLYYESRPRFCGGTRGLYEVRGESEVYQAHAKEKTCTCPARGRCSHVVAAEIAYRNDWDCPCGERDVFVYRTRCPRCGFSEV